MQRLGSVLLSSGDYNPALATFGRALQIREAMADVDADDARARLSLANSHAAMGVTLLKTRRGDAARAHFEKQRDLVEQLMIADKIRVEYPVSISEAWENLGLVSILDAELASNPSDRLRHLRTARKQLAKALEFYDTLEARYAAPAEYSGVPDRIQQAIAKCDAMLGRPQKAG